VSFVSVISFGNLVRAVTRSYDTRDEAIVEGQILREKHGPLNQGYWFQVFEQQPERRKFERSDVCDRLEFVERRKRWNSRPGGVLVMKLFSWGRDGGPKSPVWGFWFIEIKWLFSIVLLRFEQGETREAFHSHAFNALTWWLSGQVDEIHFDGRVQCWRPSFWPKLTRRSCFHKVYPIKRTWALSIRGPWAKRWHEFRKDTGELTNLENGRRVVGRWWYAP
jgi:hypothetical protein